jgi:amphiphysin
MGDEARALRDAWHTMVMTQLGAATEYVTLYDPIVGATDGHGRPAEPTPEMQLVRTFNLRKAYDDLKDDMVAEIAAFDTHVIRPVTDARESIQPLRKTIKKRENKRLDYEKCQEKYRKLQRKPGKSAKEDAQMHKHEEELHRLSEVSLHSQLRSCTPETG